MSACARKQQSTRSIQFVSKQSYLRHRFSRIYYLNDHSTEPFPNFILQNTEKHTATIERTAA